MTSDEHNSRIYPELLKAGHEICITPQGQSMVPLLDGRQDCVTIRPKNGAIRVNDLVLYTDREGRLVVHRVWDRTPAGYVLLGDGNIEKEYPISEDDIYGVCTTIRRKGKTFSPAAGGYRLYIAVWRRLYPVRRYLLKLRRILFRTKANRT